MDALAYEAFCVDEMTAECKSEYEKRDHRCGRRVDISVGRELCDLALDKRRNVGELGCRDADYSSSWNP
jgi:hypothetical protein